MKLLSTQSRSRSLWAGAASLAASLLFNGTAAAADTVVGWDFSETPTAATEFHEATDVAIGVTPQDLTYGPGIQPANLGEGFSSNGWNRDDPGRHTALTNGDYFEFGFTVEDGFRVSLSELTVSMRRSAVNAPMFFEWQYSLDGFATPGTTIVPIGPIWDSIGWTEDYFTYHGRSGVNETYVSDEPYLYMTRRVDDLQGAPMPPIVLSGIPELQDLPNGTTVTFRLYGWGNTLTTPTNTVALGRGSGGPFLRGIVAAEGQIPLTIVSSQLNTDPEPGTYLYPDGSEITVTAPDTIPGIDGQRDKLIGWTATGSAPEQGSGNSVTFTLDTPTTLEWQWERQNRLEISTEGDGEVRLLQTDRTPVIGFNFSHYNHPGDVDGQISNTNGVPASTVADGLAPSIMTRGPGLTPRGLALGGISSENWNGTPSLADAITGGKYLEFNFTPVEGTSLALNSIYAPYRYTATGPHSLALLYSFDNFSTYTVAESVRIQDQNSGTQFDSHLFILPEDPRLRDIDSEIIFRIYGWGGTGTGVGTFAFYSAAAGDDVILFGGVNTETTISGNQEIWIKDDSMIELEALPEAGNVFAGWSGDARSNSAFLSGREMSCPLQFLAQFDAASSGDGIPDWWKLHYFGDLSAQADDDPDGDGASNLEEYLRGTDPTVAEELVSTDNLALSFWENVQRDPQLPGQFIIGDFGNGFRGAWERSNNSRSALTPFHPNGESVTAVDGVSYDGPRMIIRDEAWDETWSDQTILSTVISVGDDDGSSLYFRYQDELNFYRVTITGELNDAPNRPIYGLSVSSRIDGQYRNLGTAFLTTDPSDQTGYKRIRLEVKQDGSNLVVSGTGWDDVPWTTSPGWGQREEIWVYDENLASGRAGFGTWAQGGAPGGTDLPEWNPVSAGSLFETFTIADFDGTVLFHEDWSNAPLPGDLPEGWTNPNPNFSGNWRNSAHGTLVEMSGQGENTSGDNAFPKADADGPVLLTPGSNLSAYALEMAFHPFDPGAIGFVFDYQDSENYGRVLFARNYGPSDGSIPNGVVVSRKSGGLWTDLFIGDDTFVFTEARPFLVSFSRTGSRYVMNVRDFDTLFPIHRWEWEDASAPAVGGRHGFATWKTSNAHFLYADIYGVAHESTDGELKVTAIEKVGETIVLTIENESGAPYMVQRTFDLVDGEWETIDTDQTGNTWSGPIPAGADRVFWRLAR